MGSGRIRAVWRSPTPKLPLRAAVFGERLSFLGDLAGDGYKRGLNVDESHEQKHTSISGFL